MLLKSLVLALSLFAIQSAFADEVQQIESCVLADDMKLTADTQIFCSGNMSIADDLKIDAGNFELHIYVDSGQIDYGKNTQIISGDEGVVQISALNADGKITVEGGYDIALNYGATTSDYDQELYPVSFGSAELIRNGVTVALAGPMLKPVP